MTPAHLVRVLVEGMMGMKMPAAAGDPKNVIDPTVTNLARFVQSLDKDCNPENGIVIDASAGKIVGKYSKKINFDQDEAAFTADSDVNALFKELNLTLRTPAQARNHLRRTLYGIRKTTDVKIPTRDGS
jgi:hypothetical protein